MTIILDRSVTELLAWLLIGATVPTLSALWLIRGGSKP